MRMPIHFRPKWQIIAIVVRVVQKSALFRHERSRSFACPPGVPAPRALTRERLQNFNRLIEMRSLNILRDIPIIYPTVAMGADFIS